MNHPRVTVLMSVYNDQGYLAQAVESILNQSFRDFEFLIIDDGSPDPLDALHSFSDPRIVVRTQENIGLTRSLNKGIALARGDFIARMDADDVSAPQRLEVQVAELQSHPRLDLVGSSFDVVDAEGRLIERKELIIDPVYRLWRLQFHNNYGHGTVMFRKKAVMNIGMYNEDLLYAQDFDLWSRLSNKSNTSVIPEVLYGYRMIKHSRQTSVKNYDKQLATAIGISNRSLMACNPELTEKGCEEVRALYWKFQLESITYRGIASIAHTLEGFCSRYGINHTEKAGLTSMVVRDVLQELKKSENWTDDVRTDLISTFYVASGLAGQANM
ncbi:MAG: glycosyltransferase [Desulfomonile tiedjei]|uniref:Glycosyltransferase n=1 Tax=Desulfomonile tiedjei TaxID=2358 RepID=A0A9D6V5I0_9BACT|nr:glycosyltransferase [Desulfomonile tiedjei]